MHDILKKQLTCPLKGHPLGEYTHNNILIGPAIGVGGTIYNIVTLKSTTFHHSTKAKRRRLPTAAKQGRNDVILAATIAGSASYMCNLHSRERSVNNNHTRFSAMMCRPCPLSGVLSYISRLL